MNAAKIRHELKKLESKIETYKKNKSLCIYYVFEAMRLESELDVLEVEKEENIIEAVCYRRKGNHAYLAHLKIDQGMILDRVFYDPSGYANNERRFKGKSVNCWFNLKEKPDGYYILREGQHSSSKSFLYFLLIQDEEVVEEFDSKSEMLAHASGASKEGMPELKGSPCQIAWAEKIREECQAYHLPADYSQIECKYWIDNWRNPYRIKRKMYS